MKTTIASIETELENGEWHAELLLRGVGTIYEFSASGPTQAKAISAACKQVQEKFGREFVPCSGDDEKDYREWCDAMISINYILGR